MPTLIEHIQAVQSEIDLMQLDGHHADADVRAAMERLDKGVELLHAAHRRQMAEARSQSSGARSQKKGGQRQAASKEVRGDMYGGRIGGLATLHF